MPSRLPLAKGPLVEEAESAASVLPSGLNEFVMSLLLDVTPILGGGAGKGGIPSPATIKRWIADTLKQLEEIGPSVRSLASRYPSDPDVLVQLRSLIGSRDTGRLFGLTQDEVRQLTGPGLTKAGLPLRARLNKQLSEYESLLEPKRKK